MKRLAPYLLFLAIPPIILQSEVSENLKVEQITYGEKHTFFGYIGHVQNIPWNKNERYIVALQSTFQDHLPGNGEPADVVLIDTQNNYDIEIL